MASGSELVLLPRYPFPLFVILFSPFLVHYGEGSTPNCGRGSEVLWVKLDVLLVASIWDSEKKIDDLVSGLEIARDNDSADQIVVASWVSWELVCMSVEEKTRPFCYFYETLFRTLGVCLPLTSFEMDLLNVVQVAPTQLHQHDWSFIRGFQIM